MIRQTADEHLETVLRLAFVAEFRDADTSQHLRRMSLLAGIIGAQAGMDADEAAVIAVAAPLHDIGKVAIPDEILLKPGPLTDAERSIMQDHTVIGARLLTGANSPALRMGEDIAYTHHERFDGRGYPHGVAGDDIPLSGRIVGLLDVYDALVTRRVYKSAISHADAQAILQDESGRHFCPAAVAAFFAAQDQIAQVYAEYGDEDDGDWLT